VHSSVLSLQSGFVNNFHLPVTLRKLLILTVTSPNIYLLGLDFLCCSSLQRLIIFREPAGSCVGILKQWEDKYRNLNTKN